MQYNWRGSYAVSRLVESLQSLRHPFAWMPLLASLVDQGVAHPSMLKQLFATVLAILPDSTEGEN